MNSDELKAKWNEIKDKLRQKWSQLSENDWHQTGGDKDKIIKKVQEKYGVAKEQVEKEFRDLLNKKDDSDHHH
ncbi:CsbD family protein [Rickettsiella massiliensis]|uniref:CsbD family protein n=1 Tax=Rickettsiella massiliensis TaxID=676517 RepID=UPI00029AFC49|nr:hypothetical protein [Rickettsiella massiliensis]